MDLNGNTKMMENEFRSFNGTIEALKENESRFVEGYAIRFNEESQNLGFYETIDKGAVTQEILDKSDIYCKLNHRDDAILARCRYGEGSLHLELREDGLYYSFEAPHTQYGDELLEHIKRGEISTSSFAFAVANSSDSEKWYKENGVIKRTIYKIERLFDVAPTFEGAYLTTSCNQRALDKIEELNKESLEIEERKENPLEKEESLVKENSIEERVDETKQIKTTNLKNNKLMEKEFRLLNAINAVANNKTLDETSSAVIGAGAEEMRKAGLSYGGQIQIPTSEMRAAVTVTAEGEDVVATDLYDIVEPLRAKNVLVQAGAKFLTGLVGDVQVPVMAAGNVTWEGETSNASDAGYSFTSVKLSPKRLTAFVDISKQFLVQDSKSAEALIRQDIINAINSKLEATILGSEAGTTTKPAGLFNVISGDATIATYGDICDLESDIEDANVTGETKYIMSNKAKAKLRSTQKGNGVGFIIDNGAIDGTEVLNTSNVAGEGIIYGDFSNLAIGQWGAIDLTVDPYTKAAAGQVRLVVNAYFDAKVLRTSAFATASTSAE